MDIKGICKGFGSYSDIGIYEAVENLPKPFAIKESKLSTLDGTVLHNATARYVLL